MFEKACWREKKETDERMVELEVVLNDVCFKNGEILYIHRVTVIGKTFSLETAFPVSKGLFINAWIEACCHCHNQFD